MLFVNNAAVSSLHFPLHFCCGVTRLSLLPSVGQVVGRYKSVAELINAAAGEKAFFNLASVCTLTNMKILSV